MLAPGWYGRAVACARGQRQGFPTARAGSGRHPAPAGPGTPAQPGQRTGAGRGGGRHRPRRPGPPGRVRDLAGPQARRRSLRGTCGSAYGHAPERPGRIRGTRRGPARPQCAGRGHRAHLRARPPGTGRRGERRGVLLPHGPRTPPPVPLPPRRGRRPPLRAPQQPRRRRRHRPDRPPQPAPAGRRNPGRLRAADRHRRRRCEKSSVLVSAAAGSEEGSEADRRQLLAGIAREGAVRAAARRGCEPEVPGLPERIPGAAADLGPAGAGQGTYVGSLPAKISGRRAQSRTAGRRPLRIRRLPGPPGGLHPAGGRRVRRAGGAAPGRAVSGPTPPMPPRGAAARS